MPGPPLTVVRRLATGASFERGEDYFADGRVERVERTEHGGVQATVHGSHRYRVSLSLSAGDQLEFDCDCPLGRDGVFCQHSVAACLAWRAEAKDGKAVGRIGRRELGAYLGAQTHDALVELLLDAADSDGRLRDRLFMAAASGGPRAERLATFRASVDAAVSTRGFVSWDEMWDYSSGIDESIDGLERLLGDGHADDVVELAEYALAAVEAAMQEVDDSSGYMGGILDRLQEMHLKACRRAKPDQRALAERLFA